MATSYAYKPWTNAISQVFEKPNFGRVACSSEIVEEGFKSMYKAYTYVIQK